jgi:hypothetical protein
LTDDFSLAGLAAPAEAPAPAPEEFPFVVIPPQCSFATRNIPPPSPSYVSAQDRLLIYVYNSIPNNSAVIQLRVLTPSGELKQHLWYHPLKSDRSVNWFSHELAEGFILTLTIYVTAVTPPGACYVETDLRTGGGGSTVVAQVLAMGYVSSVRHLVWPYPRFVTPGEGPGNFRTIIGTDPAPGAFISESIPTGARWKLVSLTCTLTTSATVLDRVAAFGVTDAGTTLLFLPSPTTQPASKTYRYTWALGIPQWFSAAGSAVGLPLPDELYLFAGQSFWVNLTSFAVDDDFTAPAYVVEEWIQP